ncbi:MAG: hypothetical protein ACRET7_00680 [Burkholderiales bacterium]
MLLELLPNRLLVHAIHQYADRVQYLSLQSFAPARVRALAFEHIERLTRAIIAFDPVLARQESAALLQRAESELVAVLRTGARLPAV